MTSDIKEIDSSLEDATKLLLPCNWHFGTLCSKTWEIESVINIDNIAIFWQVANNTFAHPNFDYSLKRKNKHADYWFFKKNYVPDVESVKKNNSLFKDNMLYELNLTNIRNKQYLEIILLTVGNTGDYVDEIIGFRFKQSNRTANIRIWIITNPKSINRVKKYIVDQCNTVRGKKVGCEIKTL